MAKNQNTSEAVSTLINQDSTSLVTAEEQKLKTKLKALYKAQDTLPKLIEDDSIPEQRMDDYYVNLQIMLDNRRTSGGEKEPIELKSIFDKVGNQEATGRVLIVGGPGIGKTTLLHHISYEWGKDANENDQISIFSDKFDYIFKVKLKNLTNAFWSNQSIAMDNPLEKLIYESLVEQRSVLVNQGKYANRDDNKITEAETVELLKKTELRSKVLLLLDGYDEIAHLTNDSNHIAYQIMNEIFKYDNIVVTSRPNGVTKQLEEKFPRKIESSGLNQDSTREYLHKYFAKQQEIQEAKIKTVTDTTSYDYKAIEESFLNLYERNLTLQTTLATPINAMMVCLISSDPGFTTKFAGDFNIGSLYQEVVIWLGKRYLQKFQEKPMIKKHKITTVANFSEQDIFNLNEVKVLKQTAYKGFESNMVVIDGGMIGGYCGESSNIETVYQFGLLRAENTSRSKDVNDLLHQDHTFIHLSFQEYLTAHSLKEKLLDVDGSIAGETAQFISNHRNEPRYLVTLKLLAGLVSNDDSSQKDLLATRFWDAVTCNVDGVLEFGIETKVTLLMHLLSQTQQSTRNQVLDSKFRSMQELIEVEVLSDIGKWSDTLVTSNYMSKNIADLLKIVALDANANASSQQPAIEVIVSMVNKKEFDWSKEVLFNKLISLIEVPQQDWRVQKICLQQLQQLTDKSISYGTLLTAIKLVLEQPKPFITDDNLKTAATELLTDILKVEVDIKNNAQNSTLSKGGDARASLPTPNRAEFDREGGLGYQFITSIQNILESGNRTTVISAAEAIGKAAGSGGLSPEVASRAIKKLADAVKKLAELLSSGDELTASGLSPEFASRAVEKLAELLSSGDELTARSAAEAIDKVAGSGALSPEVASRAVEKLAELLSSGDELTARSAAQAIGKVAGSGGLSPEFASRAVEKLAELLSSGDELTARSAAQAIGKVAGSGGLSPEFASRAVEKLAELLSSGDELTARNAAQAIGKVAGSGGLSPEVASRAVEKLAELLSSGDELTARNAAQAIGKVAGSGGLSPDFASRAVEKLAELLSSGDELTARNAAQAIGKVAGSGGLSPDFASRAVEKLAELLSSGDKLTAWSAAEAIGKVAGSGGLSPEVASRAVEKLAELLSSDNKWTASGLSPEVVSRAVEKLAELLSSGDELTARSAAQAIGKVAGSGGLSPEVASRAVEKLAELLFSDNEWTARNAAQAIGKAAGSGGLSPEFASRAVEKLAELLFFGDKWTAISAAEAIGKVAGSGGLSPEFASRAVEKLAELLSSGDELKAISAAEAIGKVAGSGGLSPEFASRAVEKLAELLSSGDELTAWSAAQAIGKVAGSGGLSPDFASRAVEKLAELLSSGDKLTAWSAAEAIGKVAGSGGLSPEFASRAVEKLAEFLSSGDMMTARSAAEAIGKVAVSGGLSPEFASRAVEKLAEFLSSDNVWTAWSAAEAIGKVAGSGGLSPEFASRAVEKLAEFLSSGDMMTARSAAEAIGKVAVSGGLSPEFASRAVEKLAELLFFGDKWTAISAAQAIGKVAGSGGLSPEVASRAVEKLAELLFSDNEWTARSAAEAIGKVAGSGGLFPEFASRAVEKLAERLSSRDELTAISAAQAIGKVAGSGGLSPEFASRAVEKLAELLSSGDTMTAGSAAEAIGKVAASLNINDIANPEYRFLDNRVAEIRNAVINVIPLKLNELIATLSTLNSNPQANHCTLIKTLLSIIKRENKNAEENVKAANNAAKSLLYKLVNILNETTVELINESFTELLDLSSESAPFFKSLYHKALSDYEISKTDKDFIIHCIKGGFTSTFTKDGKIIFEGKTYHLTQKLNAEAAAKVGAAGHNKEIESTEDKGKIEANNQEVITEIIRTALQQNDRLAKQYREYTPLFPNNNSFRLAASDIGNTPETRSIIDGSTIESDSWQTSLMNLSDHKKQQPSNTILVAERRTEFGDIEIRKFYLEGTSIREDRSVKYPSSDDISTTFLKSLFGNMEYHDSSKPRYYATSSKLDLKTGQELFKALSSSSISDNNSNIYEIFRQIVDTSLSNIVERTSEDISDKVNIFKTELSLSSPWDNYKNGACTVLNKIDLLRISDEFEAERIRQASFKTEFIELKCELQNIKFDDLEKVIFEYKLSKEEDIQLNKVLSSPYQFAFYRSLCVQLNAMYLASSVINSKMVASQSQGAVGKIGGALSSISAHIPLVGVGVQLIGDIMKEVDKIKQEEGIKNYATIVTDSIEMAKFAKKLALRLAPYADKIPIEESTFSRVLSKISQNEYSIASIAASTITSLESRFEEIFKEAEASKANDDEAIGVIGVAKRFFKVGEYKETKSDEERTISEAEEKATGVGKFVIKMIFEGKTAVSTVGTIEEKIGLIINQGVLKAAIGTPDTNDDIPINQGVLKAAIGTPDTNDDIPSTRGFWCCCTIAVVNKLEYDNPVLGNTRLMQAATKRGPSVLNKLLDLGSSSEIAEELLSATREHGAEYVVTALFGDGRASSVDNSSTIITASPLEENSMTVDTISGITSTTNIEALVTTQLLGTAEMELET
ncbi:NACHT domain-containing protein (plasmid) [Candidatus Megaera polyxenophila]|uniref:NACHT domain-containing protein n=1 Tax=Candidatus Megaera polyxenophila TaxID=988779 RepID=UPI00249F0F4B|nr:NACHT domain-containing protein [Candidatus Megaera polyxenophila]